LIANIKDKLSELNYLIIQFIVLFQQI